MMQSTVQPLHINQKKFYECVFKTNRVLLTVIVLLPQTVFKMFEEKMRTIACFLLHFVELEQAWESLCRILFSWKPQCVIPF